MKTIKTYKQAQDFCKSQLTAQNLINGRIYGANGWEDVEVSAELIEELAIDLSEVYGGMTKTKNKVYNTIKKTNPQHWGINRTYLEERQGRLFWVYCAGQDHTSELKEIRNALKK